MSCRRALTTRQKRATPATDQVQVNAKVGCVLPAYGLPVPVEHSALPFMKSSSDQRSWTVEHFSQANPVGEGQGDVPALLRRAADSIDALGEVEVQDLLLHIEVAESGGWPSLTVYFHRSTALRRVP